MRTIGRCTWISGLFIAIAAVLTYFEQAFLCVFKIDGLNASICIKAIAIFETVVVISLSIMIRTVYKKEMILWFVLIMIACIAAMTIFKYGYMDINYKGHYMGYFVRVVPSVLGGTLLSRKKRTVPWQTALQLVSCFFALGIVNALITGDVSRLYRFYGINYQSLSYLGAVGFCLSGVIFIYYDVRLNCGIFRKKRFVKVLTFCILTIDCAAIYFGQGRGAAVIVFLFVLYYMTKINFKLQKTWIYIWIILLIICFFSMNGFMATLLNGVLDGRISYSLSNLLNNDGVYISSSPRIKLYQAALQGFMKNPIFGNGLGSVFYEAGYYSHNVVTDILCEQGILGITVAFFIVIFIWRKKRANRADFVTKSVFLIFIIGVLNLCFSGYYLDSSSVWFALGYFATCGCGEHITNTKRRQVYGYNLGGVDI